MNRHKVQRPSLGARRAFERAKKHHINGDYSESAIKFQESLNRAPNWDEPRIGFADSLRRLGDVRQSLSVAFTCLDARPVSPIGVKYLCGMLYQFGDHDIDQINLEGCLDALELKDLDLQPLFNFVIKFLLRIPPLSTAMQMGRNQSWDKAALWLTSPNNINDLNNRLFNLFLSREINRSLEFELLLTGLRKVLAESLLTSEKNSLFFQNPDLFASIIQQSINNEFVFYVEEDEQRAIEKLTFNETSLLSGSADAMQSLTIISMYEPLKYHFIDPIDLEVLKQQQPTVVSKVWAKELDLIFDVQMRGVDIPSFGSLDDKVSIKVAEQYEENPYPRWMSHGLTKSEKLYDDLREMYSTENLQYKKKKRKILIAGCGTGSQVAFTAAGFGSMAEITAIDLSKSSLAYAERKIEEFGFNNVSFIQGDILDLSALDQEFDVIICTGVLHHMDDPFAGWQELTDHLVSGGAMNIALYSAVARKQKNEIFSQVGVEESAETDEKVRLFRHKMLTEKFDNWVNIADRFTDFYSLSGCRDLFFHVQETEYSIPEIKNYLTILGLTFLRFNLPIFHTSKFEKIYPGSYDQRNLDLWNQFENFNPYTFSGMYNFWCIKP